MNAAMSNFVVMAERRISGVSGSSRGQAAKHAHMAYPSIVHPLSGIASPQPLPAASTHVVSADRLIRCFPLSTGPLPSDRVAGFGEGDVQQIAEKFQLMRGSHLAQFVEPADYEPKCFRPVFCLVLVRHFSAHVCVGSR
ncbi:hypothetical protein ACWGS9_32220 [Bradyrhizobium sp. Arg314]